MMQGYRAGRRLLRTGSESAPPLPERGSHSWRLAASDLPLAGTIGFYGKPALVEDVLDRIHRPLLMLVAGADATPQAEFDRMDQRLTAAGREHEMYVYANAPHSFFDRASDQWQDACTDAWRRILDFIDRRST